MGFVFAAGVLLVAVVVGAEASPVGSLEPRVDYSMETELELVFTIFRHGDRTPDQEELALYPDKLNNSVFFPFGMKALTNKGKQRGFAVGMYLRDRYDGFISQLYLPDEISVRTTSYARTKMTALTALAALYPPPPAQKWNPALNWQPVPYDTEKYEEDDLMYWYNCPRYLKLRDSAYQEPEIIEWMKPYQGLIRYLREKTGTSIKNPEDVFYLDNSIQTLRNVGVMPPTWLKNVSSEIKAVTKIEFAAEFYTNHLIKLSSGVLLHSILNDTRAYIAGDMEQPRLRLYSAHENNVAALLAAARVFEPHQPNYGATFSIEMSKGKDGKHYIAAVYAKDAGGPPKVLPINGCGGGLLCEYDKFVSLVEENAWSKDEFYHECGIVPS